MQRGGGGFREIALHTYLLIENKPPLVKKVVGAVACLWHMNPPFEVAESSSSFTCILNPLLPPTLFDELATAHAYANSLPRPLSWLNHC